MKKPYIICHMMMSIDGRIDCPMTENLPGVEEYYSTLDSFECKTHVSGKITAKIEISNSKKIFVPKNNEPISKEEFFIGRKNDGYEIIVDNKGELYYDDNEDNYLIITSEKVSKDYLSYLKERKISYIVTGKDKVDLNKACEILYKEFLIEKMVVVGGGHINGGFLKENLIDEISILIGAGVDGRENMASVFDGLDMNEPLRTFTLKDVKVYKSNGVWIKYLRKENN